jgi:hypothetical protein
MSDFSQRDEPRRNYERGMVVLGRALIVLGALNAILSLCLGGLLTGRPGAGGLEIVVPAILLTFGVAIIVMGVLALKLHMWVNIVVIVLMCLALGLDGLLALIMLLGPADPGLSKKLVPMLVRSAIEAAFLYYAIMNLRYYFADGAGRSDDNELK